MPLFTYVGDAGRYYPFLAGGLTPEPDSEHELDEAPVDGRWHDADGQLVTEPAVVVDEAPVDDEPVDDNDLPADGEHADEPTDTDTPGGK